MQTARYIKYILKRLAHRLVLVIDVSHHARCINNYYIL